MFHYILSYFTVILNTFCCDRLIIRKSHCNAAKSTAAENISGGWSLAETRFYRTVRRFGLKT